MTSTMRRGRSSMLELAAVLLACHLATCEAFSQGFCDMICDWSDTVCWVCERFHDRNTDVPVELRPPSVQDLVRKAKISSRQHKIVGGFPLPYGEAPWTVSIKYRDGRDFYTFCGGTLVSDKYVVTAAHCIQYQEPEELFVGIGDYRREERDHGEVLVAVLKVLTHPDFSTMTYHADIGVLELAQKVTFDPWKQPADIAEKGLNLTGTRLNVTGWGTLRERGEYSNQIRWTTVPYVSFKDCRDAYKDISMAKILPGMICAGWLDGGTDACQGDSGGPLVLLRDPEESEASQERGKRTFDFWNDAQELQGILSGSASIDSNLLNALLPKEIKTETNKDQQIAQLTPDDKIPTLVGVVSWGMGCGRPTYAGVYTDVRLYRDWLIEAMNGEPDLVWSPQETDLKQ